jgi:hypothetical protein
MTGNATAISLARRVEIFTRFKGKVDFQQLDYCAIEVEIKNIQKSFRYQIRSMRRNCEVEGS